MFISTVGKDIMKDATASTASLMTKIIPLKPNLEEMYMEADGDTEQTTASIKSVSTPAKNQLELEDSVNQLETINEINVQLNFNS